MMKPATPDQSTALAILVATTCVAHAAIPLSHVTTAQRTDGAPMSLDISEFMRSTQAVRLGNLSEACQSDFLRLMSNANFVKALDSTSKEIESVMHEAASKLASTQKTTCDNGSGQGYCVEVDLSSEWCNRTSTTDKLSQAASAVTPTKIEWLSMKGVLEMQGITIQQNMKYFSPQALPLSCDDDADKSQFAQMAKKALGLVGTFKNLEITFSDLPCGLSTAVIVAIAAGAAAALLCCGTGFYCYRKRRPSASDTTPYVSQR